MKVTVAVLWGALATAGAQTAALKAVVELGSKDEVKIGTLTVAAAGLDFEGAELLFTLPLDCIDDVEVAGFRERWLSIGVRADCEFARSYSFLLQADHTGAKNGPARVQFLLPPNADLKAAVAIARDFKMRAEVAIATRRAAAEALAKAAKERADQEARQRATQQQQRQAELPAPAAPAQEKRQEPPPPKILAAMNAYYLDKKPGALMKNYGTPGELVFRNDGIGFTFYEPGKLNADRQHIVENSNLFVPFESLQTGFVRDQKLLLGAPPTMFFVVLKPRANSEAYTRLRPFLTPEGEILFTVRAIRERDRIRSLLTRVNVGNF